MGWPLLISHHRADHAHSKAFSQPEERQCPLRGPLPAEHPTPIPLSLGSEPLHMQGGNFEAPPPTYISDASYSSPVTGALNSTLVDSQ